MRRSLRSESQSESGSSTVERRRRPGSRRKSRCYAGRSRDAHCGGMVGVATRLEPGWKQQLPERTRRLQRITAKSVHNVLCVYAWKKMPRSGGVRSVRVFYRSGVVCSVLVVILPEILKTVGNVKA